MTKRQRKRHWEKAKPHMRSIRKNSWTLDISTAAVVSATRCWGQRDLMFFAACQMIFMELPSWLEAEISLSFLLVFCEESVWVCVSITEWVSGWVGTRGISCIMYGSPNNKLTVLISLPKILMRRAVSPPPLPPMSKHIVCSVITSSTTA